MQILEKLKNLKEKIEKVQKHSDVAQQIDRVRQVFRVPNATVAT